MAGLAKLVRDPVHNRERLGDKALGGRVLLRQAEKPESELVALLVGGLGKIATLLQAKQHAEDLRDGAVQPPGDFAYGKSAGSAGEQLQDVQTFFQCRGGIVPLYRRFGSGHLIMSK